MVINKKTWAVVIIALSMTYLKTAEAMVQYSPRSFMGWSDPSLTYLWAYISAGLVEGVALMAFDNLRKIGKDSETRTVSAVIAIMAVIFSITMNIIDQKINEGTLAGGLATPMGGVLHTVLGLIPIITAVLFGIMIIVDSQFADHTPAGRGGGGGGGNWQERPRPSRPEPEASPARLSAPPAPHMPVVSGPVGSAASGNGHAAPGRPTVAESHGYSPSPSTPRP